MIEQIRNISRTSIVRSQEQRDFDDRVAIELSNTYHRILRLYGHLKTVSTSVILTENTIIPLLRYQNTPTSGQIVINAMTAPLYPTSVVAAERAEVSPEFGIIHAKRVESQLVFTNAAGTQVKPNITITRTSENSMFLETPESIIENYLENMLVGDIPYIARFVKENMSKSQLSVDVRAVDNKFKINALRFIPMPGAGSVTLDGVYYDGINAVQLNGGIEYQKPTEYTLAKTMPGYLHFAPVDTSIIRVAVSSTAYVTKLKAVALGLSRIVGEINIYSQNSYIGYEITHPNGYSTLKTVTISGDAYGGSLSGVYCRLYTSKVEFDNMSQNYAARFATGRTVNIANPAGGLYLLLELQANNNTSPTVGKITLEFE